MSQVLVNIDTVMTAANIILTGINVFLVYYGIRRSSKLAEYSQFVDIVQKSDIWIKINAPARNEIIEVTNKGQNPINKIESTISLSAKIRDETIDFDKVKFIRDDDLRPTESFQIPLHEKLRKMLLDSKIMRVREEEVPSGGKDPFTGEDIFVPIDVKHLLKEFVLKVQIELNYKVFQEEIDIKKQIELRYTFEPDFRMGHPRYQFEDNYDINIYEISGKWADSSEKE